jgi:GDPmannose 4,6-dehydratase
MWRMLQIDTPDTFVLATNRMQSVREFVVLAFKSIGVSLEWSGSAESEKAVDTATGKTIVQVNPKFYRPAEVELLIGDPSKAKSVLGWEAKTTLEELCQLMVAADLQRNAKGHTS